MKAVMKMYKEVLSQVKVEGEDSKEFAMRVGRALCKVCRTGERKQLMSFASKM